MVATVRAAIATVDDPEMPGISIVDLGLLETVAADDHGSVTIGLLPTFSGCPALDLIADRVRHAVESVDGVTHVHVAFLHKPVWSVDRVTLAGERALAERLGIAVERGGSSACPRCGATTEQQSLFGPTRCRAVHTCPSCGEVVEVMR
jgi:ring-1,2-phenylacetyl-CoA epoxidase subunit PaaD